MNWRDPVPFADGDPRSPYAHWWRDTVTAESADPDRRARADQLLTQNDETLEVMTTLKSRFPGGVDLDRVRLPELVELLGSHLTPLEAAVPAILQPDRINRTRNDDSDLDFGPPLNPGSAIVAVIDDGIPFAHERLRAADDSPRVAWTWLQGARVAPRPNGRPGDLPFGRELDRREIRCLMKDKKFGGRVDEEEIYRSAGFQDFARSEVQSSAFRASHGASVVDIAAGAAPGELDDLHVLAVSLPTEATRDTSGAFVAFYVIFAIKAIFNRAEQMIKRTRCALGDESFDAPIIVNISFGLTAGPKDGTSLIERFIEARIAQRPEERAPILFTFPAGNHRLARTRARLDVTDLGPIGLRWRLPADDATPSFLEIRGRPRPRPVAPSFTVELSPPGGGGPIRAPAAREFGTFSDLVSGDAVTGRAYFLWEPQDVLERRGPGRETVVIVLRPTVPETPDLPFSQPGDWLVRPVPVGRDIAAFPLDLFVQRDDTIPGFRRGGRQSRFDDPAYRLFDESGRPVETDTGSTSAIMRSGTLNSLGCGPSIRLVGAALAAPDGPASRALAFSAYGFDQGDPPAFRRGPDLLAPTERSRVLRNVLTAGTLSGAHTAVTGTSFAAPRVARAIARGLMGLDWPQPRRGSDPTLVLRLGTVPEQLVAAGIVAPFERRVRSALPS